MTALVRPYQCVQCLAMQDDPARPGCKNPDWHAAPAPEPPVLEPEPDEDGPFA